MDRNPDVFEKFYADNYEEILLRCRRGGFAVEDAEDITENIFLRLWTNYNDDYILYNRGYIYKYLINYEIINYIIKNERYEMLKSKLPKGIEENKDFNALINHIKENLSKKDKLFFEKVLLIGRSKIDAEHRRNFLFWQKYKEKLLRIIKKF